MVGPQEFNGVAVDSHVIPPPTQGLQKQPAPLWCAYVLNRRPTGGDDGLEVVDQLLRLALQPRRMSIYPECVVHPLLCCPTGGRVRKRDLVIDITIHFPWLRYGRVVL